MGGDLDLCRRGAQGVVEAQVIAVLAVLTIRDIFDKTFFPLPLRPTARAVFVIAEKWYFLSMPYCRR